MSDKENSPKGFWSEKRGYIVDGDIAYFGKDPSALVVNDNLLNRENWSRLSEMSHISSQVIQNFNFEPFNLYLDQTPSSDRLSLIELVDQEILPDEVLLLHESLITLSSACMKTLSYESENRGGDFVKEATMLLLLANTQDAIYCVSNEGLSANEFELGHPPTLEELGTHLKRMKALFGFYLGEGKPDYALMKASVEKNFLDTGVLAQMELLETRNESLERKSERNNEIRNYQELAYGYQKILEVLKEDS